MTHGYHCKAINCFDMGGEDSPPFRGVDLVRVVILK